MVGCVLTREGEIVGEGHHREYGGPHAEAVALSRAGEKARGGTAYVSLEPCRHQGKTPPCAAGLAEAGIGRVVYGAADPGARSGGGGEWLRASGKEVVGPALTPAEARRENPAFFHSAESERPYVAIKMAMSLDGGIASAPGRRTRITGPQAGLETHYLRSGFDAVMVGSRTARTDDPFLTVREGGVAARPPARVVLDTRGRLPSRARLLRSGGGGRAVVLTSPEAPPSRVSRLREAGATVLRVPAGEEGLEVESVLRACRREGLRSILCEGGGRLVSSLLREGVANRLHLFIAPTLLGAGAVPAFPGAVGIEEMERWTPLFAGAIFGRDTLVVFEREERCSPGS